MRSNVVLALLLIAAGIAMFVYQGFTYQTREKVLDLGAVQVTADRTKTIPLPPVLGALAIAGGLVLLSFSGRKG